MFATPVPNLPRYDPPWAAQYHQRVLTLIRDIANPSRLDPHFTQWRHFDWYVGHAWAGGIFPLPQGRNQESNSESINAWTAIALYGEAVGSRPLALLGRAQAWMETMSAKYYWHVPVDADIYPNEFKHKLVGILFDSQVLCSCGAGAVHARRRARVPGLVECMHGEVQGSWHTTKCTKGATHASEKGGLEVRRGFTSRHMPLCA